MHLSAVAWWGYGIAVVILLLLLGGMIALIRVMSEDSEKYKEIKEILDPLFHTPSFLRPGPEAGSGSAESGASRTETAAAQAGTEPFEDECPACGEKVTHRHAECPSCGLRFLS